jgi:palmitoyltransferase
MNWKQLFALYKTDKIGIVVSSVLLLMVTINNLITLNGISSENATQATVLLLVGLFLLTNTIVNMARGALTDTTINSIQLQIKQLPEWKYCSHCEQYAPPRSYHCYACDKCILKRHNHCLFLGKCVGHKNFRFYLLFILYVWLGSVYSTYLNWAHFVDVYNHLSFKSLMVAFMPMFAWAFGMVTAVEFFFTFINSIVMIMSFLMFFYFLMNLRMVLNGQTWNESAKNINIYKLHWRENLREVLGNNWLMASFNALSNLDLPGDGTAFKKSELFHQVIDTNIMNDFAFSQNYALNHSINLQQRRII